MADNIGIKQAISSSPHPFDSCKQSTMICIDISTGAIITDAENFATEEKKSFAKVRNGFIPTKGQKVGIAIYFPEEGKPNKKTVATVFEDEVRISEMGLETIYGKHNQVNIYTGEILYVGPDFIEYDINSFMGCSGAVVFLLDMNQPDSLDQANYGKAIAIHSGAHPTVGDRNVGFLINSYPVFAG